MSETGGMALAILPGGKVVGKILSKAEGFINPSTIRFTQDSISNVFQEGKGALTDTIKGLKNGSIKPEDIPPIRIFSTPDGKIWTLDNRRLKAFQEAEV